MRALEPPLPSRRPHGTVTQCQHQSGWKRPSRPPSGTAVAAKPRSSRTRVSVEPGQGRWPHTARAPRSQRPRRGRARGARALPGNAAGAGARVARRRRCRGRAVGAAGRQVREAAPAAAPAPAEWVRARRPGPAGQGRCGVSCPALLPRGAWYGPGGCTGLGRASLRPPALRGRSGPGELSGLRAVSEASRSRLTVLSGFYTVLGTVLLCVRPFTNVLVRKRELKIE